MTRRSRSVLRVAFGARLVYLAFLAPSLASWDGGGMLNVAVSIVEEHNITVDPAFGAIGRDGKYYSMWYPAVGYPERYQEQLREQGITQGEIAWNPLLSPLVEMWPVAIQQIRDAQGQNLNTFRSYRAHASTLADARNFRIVPLWWWMLPLVHISRLLGAVVAALLAICGVRLMLRDRSLPETRGARLQVEWNAPPFSRWIAVP